MEPMDTDDKVEHVSTSWEHVPEWIAALLADASRLADLLSTLHHGDIKGDTDNKIRGIATSYLERLADIRLALHTAIEQLDPPRELTIDATHELIGAKIASRSANIIADELNMILKWAEEATEKQ